MQIGVIADGQAEVAALGRLLTRITCGGSRILRPLYADMQPGAPVAQICRAAETRFPILRRQGADHLIVLLDKERRPDCPGEWANRIKTEFSNRGEPNIDVVIKNSTFENWLIGNLESVKESFPKRFRIKENVLQRIERSGADSVSAQTLLNTCVMGSEYCKRKDAIDICTVSDPDIIARRSRSFRRLMRVVGHPRYLNQSLSAR